MHDGDFRFVEKLLYQQKTHDTAIAGLEAELEEMLPAYSSSIVRFSHDKHNCQNSQPEAWAIKRTESVRAKEIYSEIKRRRRRQEAIAAAMESLDDLEARLVFLKYHLGKSSRDCWRSMGLQKSRWYEMRREVVGKVAEYLGIF